jgi:hypothetical protein
MRPSRVVIETRGEDDIEWSTEDGLRGINVAPFGVVGEFEGKEITQQMVSWYEISKFTIFDLDFRQPEEKPPVQMCIECKGTGLTNGGETRCEACDGYGHV